MRGLAAIALAATLVVPAGLGTRAHADSPVTTPSPAPTVGWTPAGRQVLGVPLVFTGAASGAGVAWLDPRLLRPVLVAGTSDPPGGPWPWGGEVPLDARGRLVAAFNSGFRLGDIRGGWYGWNRTARGLVAGDASLVIYADGHATIGAWERDVAMTPNVVAVRQNLSLLVDGGRPVPAAASPGAWGATLGRAGVAWRSGVGVDANGALIYAGGGGLTPEALAEALATAGAQRAMELDINPQWVSFNVYTPQADGTVAGKKIYGNGFRPDGRYLSPDSRDFVAFLLRGAVLPSQPAPIGLGALDAHAVIRPR